MYLHFIADVVIAGVGFVGAINGALVGGKQARRASLAEFSRVIRRQEDGWRRALHFECYQNIKLSDIKPGTEAFWEFNTSVLEESIQHASAFTDEILERVIRVTSANRHLNALLGQFRPIFLSQEMPPSLQSELEMLRVEVIGEIREIFKALALVIPVTQ